MNSNGLNMKIFFIVVNILLPLCTYAQFISYSFDQNNLETERLHRCLQRSSCSEIANTTLEGVICQCDPECSMYGDCCADAIRMSSKTIIPKTCMNLGNINNRGIYVVNSCPANYAGPEEIRRLCLNDDFSDIAKSAPVTDFINRQVYLNRYCAICNKVPFISIKAWKASACKAENSIVSDFSLNDLKYHAADKKWGYELNGQFHPCKFKFQNPLSSPEVGRSCRLDYISSCSPTWNGTDYWKACESYTAVVKDLNDVLYKNPHCAICNGVTLSDIVCLSDDRKDFFPTLIDGRMDINKAFGANRMYHPIFRPPPLSCPDGQRLDRYFGICRNIICAFPGYSVRNGRCVRG